MGTGQKMGTSFPKGVKKFDNGYRTKMGTSLPKGLRNSSIGTGQIVNHIYDKNDHFYDNLR